MYLNLLVLPLLNIDRSQNLVQVLKLTTIIYTVLLSQYAWWVIVWLLLSSGGEKRRQHDKHGIELRHNEDLSLYKRWGWLASIVGLITLTFHDLVIDESGALAETLLQLEELVVLSGVEHFQFFTIVVSIYFEAKGLHINHLS